jgi:endoglucanase
MSQSSPSGRADTRLLREVCSLPTAPFAEGRVVAFVERFVAERPALRLSRDQWGNLLIQLPGQSRRKLPRWIFAAHMDHPGFVAGRMVARGVLRAAFRGSVRPQDVRAARVRFFDLNRQVVGVVRSVAVAKSRATPHAALIEVREPVTAGSPGMFDQGEARVRGRRLLSRAVDDLGGVAAALAMLDELLHSRPASPVAVLLTRAEEEGFIGAIAAATRPRLLRRSDRIVAIECSAEQSYARLGDGAIIRVGDRTSVFHSGLTWFLTRQAEELAQRDRPLRYQRALMPGGTCEATVYDAYGYVSTCICVPLGNYHNMDQARRRIGPEYIDIRDWRSMVALFVQAAGNGHLFRPGHAELKQRIEKRFARLRRWLIE